METHDDRADLATRDIVARAIDEEMKKTGAEHVWLDCSSISSERFSERFPNILETCRERGFDPPAEPLPVVPAAHYVCGGVVTDVDGRTGLEGLLAAGEVTCSGVHGANRLASNSLLEAVVFADRAADVTREILAAPEPEFNALPVDRAPLERGVDLREVRYEIGRILWAGAGIVRDSEGLEEAARRLERLGRYVPIAPSDPEAAEVANLHLIGDLILRSAISRKESRGLHFTSSFPEEDPAFEKDTVLQIDPMGGPHA